MISHQQLNVTKMTLMMTLERIDRYLLGDQNEQLDLLNPESDESKTKITITKVLRAFQETNPKSAFIESFFIDKDYTEWGVLVEVFPDGKILSCQFHVLKFLRFEFSRKKYNMGLASRKVLESCVSNMTYTSMSNGFEVAWAKFTLEWSTFKASLTRSCHDLKAYLKSVRFRVSVYGPIIYAARFARLETRQLTEPKQIDVS